MVNDMTGLFFSFRPGDMLPLSSRPCPQHPAQRGRELKRERLVQKANGRRE